MLSALWRFDHDMTTTNTNTKVNAVAPAIAIGTHFIAFFSGFVAIVSRGGGCDVHGFGDPI